MRRIPVEPGQIFGRWTVIGPSNPPKRCGGFAYDCRCVCGNVRSILITELNRGVTTRCRACALKERPPNRANKNRGRPKSTLLIGTVFGKWTITGKCFRSHKGTYLYPCQCECGETSNVQRAALLNGHSAQCRRCINKKHDDVVGKTFGGLTVLRRLTETERRSHNSAWLCHCKCGRTIQMTNSRLLRCKTGCRSCSAKKNGINYRLRPYESLYRMLKSTRPSVEITYDQFVELIHEGRCHYCWLPLQWAEHNIGRGDAGARYQLDRKDNSMGYVLSNVVPCCWRCNQAKSNQFSYEDWYGMTEPFRNGTLKHPSIN